jgi:hypothetical protein
VLYVSGNGQESIAELQAQFGDHVTENGYGLAFSFLVRFYAYQFTPRPVTWKLAFSEHPQGLDLWGDPLCECFALGLSDVSSGSGWSGEDRWGERA